MKKCKENKGDFFLKCVHNHKIGGSPIDKSDLFFAITCSMAIGNF